MFSKAPALVSLDVPAVLNSAELTKSIYEAPVFRYVELMVVTPDSAPPLMTAVPSVIVPPETVVDAVMAPITSKATEGAVVPIPTLSALPSKKSVSLPESEL